MDQSQARSALTPGRIEFLKCPGLRGLVPVLGPSPRFEAGNGLVLGGGGAVQWVVLKL